MGIFNSKKRVKVLCCGLDNSGKTTILNQLKAKHNRVAEITPTVGFALEEFTKNNVLFTVFDMSGQGRYRSLWEHYFSEVAGIIFVIDTSDKLRICVVKDELDQLVKSKELASVPILFFANKQDLPGTLTAVDCVQKLELDTLLKDRSWHITASTAVTGEGLEEGISWLSDELSKKT